MAIQMRKEYEVKEPQWEMFSPMQGTARGEYVVVQKSGALRLSREAYECLFGEPERIAVYVDRDLRLIGFNPVAATEAKAYKVSSQQTFGGRSLSQAMGLAPGRYALRPLGNLIGFDPAEDKLS